LTNQLFSNNFEVRFDAGNVFIARSTQLFIPADSRIKLVALSDVFKSKPGDAGSRNRNHHGRIGSPLNEFPLDQLTEDGFYFRSTVGIEVKVKCIVRLWTMLF
jgi:hypothetical protein